MACRFISLADTHRPKSRPFIVDQEYFSTEGSQDRFCILAKSLLQSVRYAIARWIQVVDQNHAQLFLTRLLPQKCLYAEICRRERVPQNPKTPKPPVPNSFRRVFLSTGALLEEKSKGKKLRIILSKNLHSLPLTYLKICNSDSGKLRNLLFFVISVFSQNHCYQR